MDCSESGGEQGEGGSGAQRLPLIRSQDHPDLQLPSQEPLFKLYIKQIYIKRARCPHPSSGPKIISFCLLQIVTVVSVTILGNIYILANRKMIKTRFESAHCVH